MTGTVGFKETINFKILTGVVQQIIPFLHVFKFIIYLVEQVVDLHPYFIGGFGSVFFIITSSYAFINRMDRNSGPDEDSETSVASQPPTIKPMDPSATFANCV